RQGRQLGVGRHRLHQARSDDHQQFAILSLDAAGAKEGAEHRDVAQTGKLVHCGGVAVVDQAADDETFAVGQGDAGVGAAHSERRYADALDLDAVAEIELADLGRHLQVDAVTPNHGGGQGQAYAELLVLDADAVATAARHRHGKFAAGEESRALPAQGHQAGPGQAVGEAAVLQRIEHAQYLAAAAAPDDIEAAIVERDLWSYATDLTGRHGHPAGCARCTEEEIIRTGAEDRGAGFREFAAADLDEANVGLYLAGQTVGGLQAVGSLAQLRGALSGDIDHAAARLAGTTGPDHQAGNASLLAHQQKAAFADQADIGYLRIADRQTLDRHRKILQLLLSLGDLDHPRRLANGSASGRRCSQRLLRQQPCEQQTAHYSTRLAHGSRSLPVQGVCQVL